ncbi:MAG: MarR family transcriptional regulator [Brucellaceae bacterium]|nr:MarR family transcriptional regulator [Brucellaceae bacterium]MCO5056761.1 MarR family transcriptional regulator [Rhizobiaceae bacterium]
MNKIVDPKGFGFLITDLSRLIRAEFDRRIGETGLGLTAGEARALSHVARAGGSRQSVLAEKMGVEAMTLTGFLDRLEARGLVERTTDPSDRRAKLVNLTDEATTVLATIKDVADAVRAEASCGIDEDSWRVMIDTLQRARENITELRQASSDSQRLAS